MNKAEIHSKATRWCHRFHIQFPWKFTQLNVYHCFGFNDSFLHRFTRDCFDHGTYRVAELSATGHRWEVAKLWRTITGASRCGIQLTPQQTWRRVKTMFGVVQQKHKKNLIWQRLCSMFKPFSCSSTFIPSIFGLMIFHFPCIFSIFIFHLFSSILGWSSCIDIPKGTQMVAMGAQPWHDRTCWTTSTPYQRSRSPLLRWSIARIYAGIYIISYYPIHTYHMCCTYNFYIYLSILFL